MVVILFIYVLVRFVINPYLRLWAEMNNYIIKIVTSMGLWKIKSSNIIKR